MRISILLRITTDDGTAGAAEEVASFKKATERPEDVGLALAEGKALLAAVQRRTVELQTAAWIDGHRHCAACGRRLRSKGGHPVMFRTLFGDVRLASPRFHRCRCQDQAGPATVSPLGLVCGWVHRGTLSGIGCDLRGLPAEPRKARVFLAPLRGGVRSGKAAR